MNRSILLAALSGAIALVALSGCLQGQATWYEQRCLNYGLKRGTADFDACIERDRKWLEQEQQRAREPGGNA